MEDYFLIFAFFSNHIVAYQVENTTGLNTFHLKLQHSNPAIKAIFPDKLVLSKDNGVWQPQNELEKELCSLIDEWLMKNVYTDIQPLILTHEPRPKKRRLHKK